MALPLPERWRALMGVIAGKTRQSQFLGLVLLGFSRDLLIAENSFQSGFLERPNAPMGVIAGDARQDHLFGLAVLGFSRDSLIAATIFQSGI